MDIFWRLSLSHLIADFTLQTNWINRMKRENVKGVIIHVLVHIIVTTLLLTPYLDKLWFNFYNFKLTGYAMILIICFFHFIIDQTRVYAIKNKIYPDNTISFIADQIFHFYFIFLFTPFVNVPIDFSGEKIIMLFTFLVIITHTTTIFVYYIEKDLSNLPFPSFDQKYFMIFERVVIWAFFLLNGWWWVFLLAAWIYQLYYFKKKKIIDITNVNFYISVIFSMFFGILSRHFYYK
ncbi:MAG: DUF3307 domain-containing protein [Elusimicrobiota bacterium]